LDWPEPPIEAADDNGVFHAGGEQDKGILEGTARRQIRQAA
jgi:hypothetical protein